MPYNVNIKDKEKTMKILTHIINAILVLIGAVLIAGAIFFEPASELLLKANVDLSSVNASTLFFVGAGAIGLAGVISVIRRGLLTKLVGIATILAAAGAVVAEIFLKFV